MKAGFFRARREPEYAGRHRDAGQVLGRTEQPRGRHHTDVARGTIAQGAAAGQYVDGRHPMGSAGRQNMAQLLHGATGRDDVAEAGSAGDASFRSRRRPWSDA